MSGRKLVRYYRATSFGRPVGIWRDSLRQVREDLVSLGLGSYDEWGWFFVTVPGGFETDSAWMDFDEWKANSHARRAPDDPTNDRKAFTAADRDILVRRVVRAGDQPRGRVRKLFERRVT